MNDSGAVALTRIQPGRYRVTVGGLLRGEFYLRDVQVNGRSLAGEVINVQPNDAAAKIDVFLASAPATLRVRVVDTKGLPLNAFTAVLLDYPDSRVDTPYTLLTPRGAIYAEDVGRVGIKPGRYRLLVLTPPLLDVAPHAAVFERYADKAIPLELNEGQVLEMKVAAIEARPFAVK
jgi:hypothetical protein